MPVGVPEDFDVLNQTKRTPCVLLLDTSSSMQGPPISELNDGLQAFKNELNVDDLAKTSVEVCLITFGGKAELVHDFVDIDSFHPPYLDANGGTPMGAAIDLGLDKIEERERLYKSQQIAFYRPWFFLMTDGAPTDVKELELAIPRLHGRSDKIIFNALAVENADEEWLKKIMPPDPPHMLQKLSGTNFKDFFIWLSRSLVQIASSGSEPGDQIKLEAPPSDVITIQL